MEYSLFTFCILYFLVIYKELESLNIGVGRADCTGPPVEIVFVSLKVVVICVEQNEI